MSGSDLNGNAAAESPHVRISTQAFDVFVGFIYGMTIALVIETAYLKSQFTSVVPATLTLLVLAFFAYDWLSRFDGRQAMAGKMGKPLRSTLLFRLLLEIAIVYFLLLVCLAFVEKYAPVSGDSIQNLFAYPAGKPLSYAMAAFAVFSGFWNVFMIRLQTS